MCTPIGANDAGEILDTNLAVDARLTSDAPGADAPTDAPLASDTNDDAPMPDAALDAAADAPMTCPMYASTQNVSNVRGCTGVSVTTITIAPNGMSVCGIDLFSRSSNIDGSMSLMGTTMTGSMTVGDRSYLDCTLTPGALRGEHLLACGACTVTLTGAP